MFVNDTTGSLVEITGSDPRTGTWRHSAFVPAPLPATMPDLTNPTFLAVSAARAALAALDSTASQLPNPTMPRTPALRRKAQSTSALEGTYAPLAAVLTAAQAAKTVTDDRDYSEGRRPATSTSTCCSTRPAGLSLRPRTASTRSPGCRPPTA